MASEAYYWTLKYHENGLGTQFKVDHVSSLVFQMANGKPCMVSCK